MKRVVAVTLLVICVGTCSFASLTPCSAVRLLEMRPDFVLSVTHKDRPLAGVEVQIHNNRELFLSGTTDASGKFRVTKVPPGTHSYGASFLGVSAGSDCFYVESRPSRKAKRSVELSWGDQGATVRRVAGKLSDVQRGEGGTPTWNREHPVLVPISGAEFVLKDIFGKLSYSTTSDENGHFQFPDTLPAGTYVLHVEGRETGDRWYKPADILIEISPNATSNDFALFRRENFSIGTSRFAPAI